METSVHPKGREVDYRQLVEEEGEGAEEGDMGHHPLGRILPVSLPTTAKDRRQKKTMVLTTALTRRVVASVMYVAI